MIDIYDIIKKINKRKKDEHKDPCSALYSEVMNEVTDLVKEEINNLVSEEKVKFHQTINSVSFDVVENIN